MRTSFLAPLAAASLSVLLALTACGGSEPKEPQTPPPPPAQPAAEAPPVDAGAQEAVAPEPEAPKVQRLTRSPHDIVTSADVIFMFSFNSSDISDKTEKRCDSEAGSDAKAHAECMRAVRDKIGIDGIQFKQDKKGAWWWITLRRKGSSLMALHRIEFDFGEEADFSINIHPKGKDQGLAPMARVPKEVVISVPNEYSIALDNPEWGRMVFEAKIGIAQ